MLRINKINIDCKQAYNPQFTSQIQTDNKASQVELANIQPSYHVKTPISYQKLGEKDLPFDFKAHFYKLANGQKIVIIPKEGETVVKTYVGTGSMNEPDNLRGISHYIEHNLFNGSDGLEAGDFFGTVNKMGAETNASTGFAETNYYISSNLLKDEDFEKKIKIHASMLETPKFALDMLEKEKGVVNSEINMILGDPYNIVTNETIRNLYNIKSSSNDLIAGTTNNITNLTRQDVIDYYNNNYFPANMVTVITGEVKPDETMKLVSKYFSAPNKVSQSRKFEELKPIEKTVRKDIISDKATATHIMLGFNGPKNNSVKDTVITDAIKEILNTPKTGRFNKELKPLNTFALLYTEKISSCPKDNSALLVETETTEENSEKALKAIFKQIHSLTTNPPTDEELQIIKKSLLNKYSKQFEHSYAINNFMGECMLNDNAELLTDYENLVNSLTASDIQNAAKKYFDLNKTAITVIHPQTANNERIQNRYKQAISFSGNLQKQAINPNNVKQYKAHNNFNIVTNNISTNNAEFDIHYTRGEDFPNTKPAVIYLLGKILDEGTLNKNDVEFTNNLQKDGINIYTSASTSNISINAEFASEDLQKALKAAKEILQSPRFTQETLDYVKQNLKDDLSVREKSVKDKLNKELFEGLPKGYTKEEILNSIDQVTLKDITELYKNIINEAQANITLSAPFNRKPELKDILFKEISELPTVKQTKPIIRNTYKPVTETKVLTDTHEKNQAYITEAYKFKHNGNLKDMTTIELMNIILGDNASSRLFNDLREKQQLAYHVSSNLDYVGNSGVINLNIKTTTENKETGEISYDNVQKSIDGFNKHIKQLKTEKVTDEELENAKLYLKNIILSGSESSSGKNTMLASDLDGFYGPLIFNEQLKLIDKIKAEDIYNAANYIFSEKPTYSILATENTLKANEDYFKKLL